MRFEGLLGKNGSVGSRDKVYFGQRCKLELISRRHLALPVPEKRKRSGLRSVFTRYRRLPPEFDA